MAPAPDPGLVPLQVGYTDPLLGVTTWPSTSARWEVLPPPSGAGATLRVQVGSQPGGLLPGETEAGNRAVAAAADLAQRFAAIWYQVQQPDVTGALSTSLQQPPDGDPQALPVDLTELRSYVGACYAFARAAAQLGAACADPAVTPTLADVVEQFGVDWQALGRAGGERPLAHLVDLPAQGLMVPGYAVFPAGATVQELMPPGADPVTTLADPDNAQLPLQAGTELVIPPSDRAPAHELGYALPLAVLAREFGLTPASLVRANQERPALLRPGFVFRAQGVEVEIPPLEENDPATDASLAQVAATFRQEGVPFDAVMVAGANAEEPGMFRDLVQLVVERRLVEPGWTLAANETGSSTDVLAQLNTRTPDLFPAGTPVFLGAAPEEHLGPGPLGAVARAYGIDAGDLLRHNAGLAPLAPEAGEGEATAIGLPIPGLATLSAELLAQPPAQLPPGGSGYSPAQLPSLLDRDPTLLLAANLATPGLILPGVELRPSRLLETPTVITAAEDSLNAILRRFAQEGLSVTVGDLVEGNPTTEFLAPGAVLLLPPADVALEARIGADGWAFPGTVFPLHTWLTLARSPQLVDPAFAGTSVATIASALPARRAASPTRREDGAETLDLFVATLGEAIPGLEVATGQAAGSPAGESPTDLFGVSFVASCGIQQVAIVPPAPELGDQGPQPFSFALRPLATRPESAARVPIARLDPVTGGLAGPEPRDYQGVDLEDWARAWLAGLDLLCTASYASSAVRVAPVALERLLVAKQGLAEAVADGLAPLLVEQAQGGADIGSSAWRAAREVLRELLLRSLSTAYDTTTILQYQATVDAPPNAANARLAGPLRLGDGATQAQTVRLSNAKLPLATAKGAPFSFSCDLSQPSAEPSIPLQPSYAVSELEFNIAPVVDGYVDSDWVQFIRDFAQDPPPAFSTQLGTPLLLLPLRSYPGLPALEHQEALVPPVPARIAQALRWTYRFQLAYRAAAQDQLLIAIEFNQAPSPPSGAEQTDDGLFDALAQYAAIEGPLWDILGGLDNPNASGNPVLVTALNTYAELAERVTLRWAQHWGVAVGAAAPRPADVGLVPARWRTPPVRPDAGVQHAVHTYLATWRLKTGTAVYEALLLEKLGDPDPSAPWPTIEVAGADGELIPLVEEDGSGSTRTYRLPDDAAPVPAFTRLRVQVTVPDLSIARQQNATAGVSLVRNARLLGPSGPATCSSFVYRTPLLSFPAPLVPRIVVPQRVLLDGWEGPPAGDSFPTLLDRLFGGDWTDREASLAIRYGYTLAGEHTSRERVETLLPVALYPRMTVTRAALAQVRETLERFLREVQPVRSGAFWSFALSLYATTNPELERPILELKRLELSVEPVPAGS